MKFNTSDKVISTELSKKLPQFNVFEVIVYDSGYYLVHPVDEPDIVIKCSAENLKKYVDFKIKDFEFTNWAYKEVLIGDTKIQVPNIFQEIHIYENGNVVGISPKLISNKFLLGTVQFQGEFPPGIFELKIKV